MHIIFCTSSSTKSGGSRQALYLAQEFVRRGHSLTFFTPAHSTLRSLAPEIHWADLPDAPGQWRAAIEAALPEGAPAVFHAFHNKAVKKAAWWGLCWRSRGVVCVAHRGVVYKPGNPLPYWSPGIGAFAVNSKACAKVLARYGLSKKRLHVVYNGIPDARTTPATPAADMRAALNIPESHFVFGTVAGNNPVKGADVMLRAFALADLKDTTLVAVGVGADVYGPLAEELGISDRVRLVGHTENVADHLNCLDAFILPSRSESMPNTLLEAIRMGLPSVATDVGGVKELLADTGIAVPAENPEAMAAAMTTMRTDTDKREAFAANSRALAPQYSIGNRADRMEAIYRDLLAARGLSTR
ncbi:glycosyltransferase family 4 protein [Desulfovibrio mangrovi]|uniref:glycosyltransferase family 4 protein n=1 Tax=Desulfovibrio mangrovi TaxID=2976983 RepID=UPI0022466DCB|nr:glycosyltransferase family 4 protein [Desulfovibrio mangrovi]UZP68880.1 glycosyltransferase family 4 protein [Desulfovibrio mangrovi]